MNRLLPVFAIFLAIGLYFLYIQPTLTGSVATEQAKITSYSNALIAAKSFAAKQDQLVAQRNSITEPEVTRLEEFLPDSVDNVQLILDLTSLASRSGITLSNFAISDNAITTNTGTALTAASVQNTTPGAGAQPSVFGNSNLTSSLDISVDAKGTYPAFRTFLSAAEQSLRPLDIMKVEVKSAGNGVYNYSITFRIYWLT